MKLRDYVLNQIKHRDTHPVPFTFACESEVAQRLTEYYGSTDWRKKVPKYMASYLTVSTLQEVQTDSSHRVDGYGAVWRTDRLPWHLEKQPLPEPTLKGYNFPALSKFVDPVLKNKVEAIPKIQADTESFHVIGMGWGIFEVSWRLRGFENVLMDMVDDPDFYRELTARITELYVGMVRACADVPADAFLFGDDWGDQRGVTMGPDRWREFIKPCWKQVYDEVHRQGKIVMSHSCGSVADILDDAIEIGLDVLESVQPEAAGMNTLELKKRFGDRITFYGCLGSQSLIPYGTPYEIRHTVRRLCKEAGKGGGLILAPAKPLRPETPTENAVALLEALANQE
ncbi:MAG TPA: hypothetical protein DD727_07355 [Clostridiales bacterium]|nr:hypothetical protein [Clostridiales bacterium]